MYNVAVSKAMYTAVAALPIQPSQSIDPTEATSLASGQTGKYQPGFPTGFPVHPVEANTITSNLTNSNFRQVAAVNSEGHPGQVAALPIQPSQLRDPTEATSHTSGQRGNCQPRFPAEFPVHSLEANTITSNVPNSNFRQVAEVKSEGHPGQLLRTGYSPGMFIYLHFIYTLPS